MTKVDGMLGNFNGFFELPLEIFIFLGKDLGLLQANMVFGGARVLSQSKLLDPIMLDINTVLLDPSTERTTYFPNIGGSTRELNFIDS